MKPIVRGLVVAGVLAVAAIFLWLRYGSQLTYDHITPPTKSLDSLRQGLPNFELKTLEGASFKFEKANPVFAKTVILHFWASWCGPCIEEFPSLVKMAKKLGNQAYVIAVSADEDAKSALEFIREQGALPSNFVVLLDESYRVAQLFGTEQIPESYILNSDFTLRQKIPNASDWMSPQLLNLVLSKE